MGRKSDLTIEDYRCQFCSSQLSIPSAINEKVLKCGDFDKRALFCSFIFKKNHKQMVPWFGVNDVPSLR